jgi:protein-L-isoaspartate(D-aspartate) O-methyltransferase
VRYAPLWGSSRGWTVTEDDTRAAIQRENMVESQVRPSDVTDRRIIRAMAAVPRHDYVPAERRAIAYMDSPVPLGRGRELTAPRLFAKMAQALTLPDAKATVLVGGSGGGYALAVLAQIAKRVVGIEPDPALAADARATLTRGGITNVVVTDGPIADGNPAEAPFDAILLDGGVPSIPRALLDQLKDQGRLVAVVTAGRIPRVVVAVRSGQTFDQRDLFDGTAAALPGFARKAEFTF